MTTLKIGANARKELTRESMAWSERWDNIDLEYAILNSSWKFDSTQEKNVYQLYTNFIPFVNQLHTKVVYQ